MSIVRNTREAPYYIDGITKATESQKRRIHSGKSIALVVSRSFRAFQTASVRNVGAWKVNEC